MNKIKTIQEKLSRTPLFSNDNVELGLYAKLTELRKILCEREEDSEQLLNKGNIIAVWLLTGLTFDGKPQLIVRKTIASDEYESLLLDKEIFDIVGHDIAYDYDEDVVEGSSVIVSAQEDLFSEIMENRVVCVYDKERDG